MILKKVYQELVKIRRELQFIRDSLELNEFLSETVMQKAEEDFQESCKMYNQPYIK